MTQIFRSFRNPATYIAGPSLAVLLLMGLSIMGCGGEDAPPSTPTATFTPQVTATPPPQGGATAGTQIPETDAPAEAVSSSGSESLFLSASEHGEITVELMAGDRLQVTFDVESNITGGQNVIVGKGKAIEGIQLVISDPLGDSLLTIEETTASGTVEVDAEVNGEHVIIFLNPFLLQAQTIEVTYNVNP